MRKLTVLVDMDDTIENLGSVWLSELERKHHTGVCLSDVKSWNLLGYFPTLTKQEVFAPLATKELWDKVVPLPGAQQSLAKLIEDGHDVYIVTASDPRTVHIKMNRVLFKYFPFIDIKHVVLAYRKQMVYGDVMVDDGPHNLVDRPGLKVLFSTYHNLSYDADGHGMYRVKDWEETYRLISKYAEI